VIAALFYRNAAGGITGISPQESQRLAGEEAMLERTQAVLNVGPEFSQNI
jgi:hypothetical protein